MLDVRLHEPIARGHENVLYSGLDNYANKVRGSILNPISGRAAKRATKRHPSRIPRWGFPTRRVFIEHSRQPTDTVPVLIAVQLELRDLHVDPGPFTTFDRLCAQILHPFAQPPSLCDNDVRFATRQGHSDPGCAFVRFGNCAAVTLPRSFHLRK
jgi:hypothetical protein